MLTFKRQIRESIFVTLLTILFFGYPSISAVANTTTGDITMLVYGKDITGESIFDYEKAKAFLPSRNLKFSIDEKPKVSKGRIHLVGTLVNQGEQETIIVFPVFGSYPFWAEIELSADITMPPREGPMMPQQAPPPPLSIKVPANATIRFEYYLDLSKYRYTGSPTAKVKWEFHYWNQPWPSGALFVELPSR